MKVALLLLAAATAWAQVDAPLLGYLGDQGRIRPILGIPESAIVAPALDAGPFARIAAAGNTVVASAVESGAVMLYRAGAFTAIPASPSPDLIVLSPTGTAAALWYASSSRAEIVTNLSGSPSVRSVPAPFRPTTPTLAVSDDGEWLAGVWPDGVYAFGRDRQPAPLFLEGRTRSLAFAPGSHRLAAGSTAGVFDIADIASASAALVQAGPLRSAAVAFSPAGEAFGSDAIDCQCQPESLTPLSNGVFLLAGLHSGAALLYDARTGKVLYAPLSLSEASNLEASR